MGLFGSLFGGSKEKELPPLDANSPAAQRLGKIKADLEAFVGKMNDRLEFVPADDAVYCFIGKPPAMFGMVWFSEGKEHNLKTLAAAKGLTNKKTQRMSLLLGEQSEKFMAEPKFCTHRREVRHHTPVGRPARRRHRRPAQLPRE